MAPWMAARRLLLSRQARQRHPPLSMQALMPCTHRSGLDSGTAAVQDGQQQQQQHQQWHQLQQQPPQLWWLQWAPHGANEGGHPAGHLFPNLAATTAPYPAWPPLGGDHRRFDNTAYPGRRRCGARRAAGHPPLPTAGGGGPGISWRAFTTTAAPAGTPPTSKTDGQEGQGQQQQQEDDDPPLGLPRSASGQRALAPALALPPPPLPLPYQQQQQPWPEGVHDNNCSGFYDSSAGSRDRGGDSSSSSSSSSSSCSSFSPSVGGAPPSSSSSSSSSSSLSSSSFLPSQGGARPSPSSSPSLPSEGGLTPGQELLRAIRRDIYRPAMNAVMTLRFKQPGASVSKDVRLQQELVHVLEVAAGTMAALLLHHSLEVEHAHVSAAASCVGKLIDRSGLPPATVVNMKPVQEAVLDLIALLVERPPPASGPDLVTHANVLWAAAKAACGSTPGQHDMDETGLPEWRVVTRLPILKSNAEGDALELYRLALMLVNHLGDIVPPLVQDASPRDVATLMWSLQRLRLLPPPEATAQLVGAVAAHVASHVGQYGPQDLSVLTYSLGSLQLDVGVDAINALASRFKDMMQLPPPMLPPPTQRHQLQQPQQHHQALEQLQQQPRQPQQQPQQQPLEQQQEWHTHQQQEQEHGPSPQAVVNTLYGLAMLEALPPQPRAKRGSSARGVDASTAPLLRVALSYLAAAGGPTVLNDAWRTQLHLTALATEGSPHGSSIDSGRSRQSGRSRKRGSSSGKAGGGAGNARGGDGADVDPEQALLDAAADTWSNRVLHTPRDDALVDKVASHLEQFGVEYEHNAKAEAGMRVTLRVGPPHLRSALELVHATHYTLSKPYKLMGRTALRHRVLVKLGWRVRVVSWLHMYQYRNSARNMKRLIWFKASQLHVNPTRATSATTPSSHDQQLTEDTKKEQQGDGQWWDNWWERPPN